MYSYVYKFKYSSSQIIKKLKKLKKKLIETKKVYDNFNPGGKLMITKILKTRYQC